MKWALGASDQEKTKHNPEEGRDMEGGWRGGEAIAATAWRKELDVSAEKNWGWQPE